MLMRNIFILIITSFLLIQLNGKSLKNDRENLQRRLLFIVARMTSKGGLSTEPTLPTKEDGNQPKSLDRSQLVALQKAIYSSIG